MLKTSIKKFPTFDSPIYSEMKQFEPHELSTCIAYEAAIRVPHIRKALIKFTRLYQIGKSKYCKYELEQKAKLWHCRLDLFNHGFDLAASIYFSKKRRNPNHSMGHKKLVSTPIKYQEDRYTGNLIRIKKMPNGSIRRRDIQTGQRKETINWDEFGFAPMFILENIMHRPIIRNPIRHHFFYTPMNFALELPELIEQLTVMKEQYDHERNVSNQAQEKHKSYLNHSLKNTDEKLREVIMKILIYSSHSKDENLLSAGDIVANGSLWLDQITRKKHNPSMMMAEVFFVHDAMKFMEKFNKDLSKKRDKAEQEIRATYYSDQSEELILELNEEYEKKRLTASQIKDMLYKQIKDKNTENRGNKKISKGRKRTPNIVDDRLKFAKMLIIDEGYKSLI